MADYIDRNHAIAALSILEVKTPGADLRDARRAIADLPEPSREDKLRYALGVISDECRSCAESCWDCLLCIFEGVGSYCSVSDFANDPADWELEKMISAKK